MSNNCKPCNSPLIKVVSSNPSLKAIIESVIQEVNTLNPKVTVEGDDEFIFVEETVNPDESITYTVSYSPYIPLSISSFTDDIGLQVKGVTVSTFTLNWNYNKGVESQSLNQGLTAPAVVPGQTSYSLTPTGQTITTDTTITLTADDVDGDGNAAKTSNVSILFGNYIYQTQLVLADRTDIVEADITGLDLTSLTRTLSRTKDLTFTCSSGSTEYEVILMPTSFGLTSGGSFQDLSTNFTGGWSKLLTVELTNEEGFAEDYDVFVASNKNLNGLTFQIS